MATRPLPTSSTAWRADRVDALRTLAMVWMTAFHFSFDLHHFRLIPPQQFLQDPFWTWQRTAIVSLFLFTAGVSQALAMHQQNLLERPVWARLDARFWRRWLLVAGCAVLVSAGSAWMFPNSWIHFGVLHGLAAMLVIARLTAGWGAGLWLAALAVLALKEVAGVAHQASASVHFFNEIQWNWLGFIGRKPVTEDYVPLIPWLAAVWCGLASGFWALRHRPHWLRPPHPAAWERRWMPRLATPGRWSLSYYMIHQPVLLGALWVGIWALR